MTETTVTTATAANEGPKYLLLKNSVYRSGDTDVYRIISLRDIKNEYGEVLIPVGCVGGFIESYQNLSQEGTCWVYDNAVVKHHAVVKDNAVVKNDSIVCDHAVVRGDAVVSGKSVLSDFAEITDRGCASDAILKDAAVVRDDASVLGSVVLGGSVIQDSGLVMTSSVIAEAIISGLVSCSLVEGCKTVLPTEQLHENVKCQSPSAEFDNFGLYVREIKQLEAHLG